MIKYTSGADYAEWFEWKDIRSEKQNNFGYFVTLDGSKIKIATSNDDILGVVSSTPSIIGSFIENNKFYQYLTDEFGIIKTEAQEITYTILEWNDETHELESVEKTEIAEIQLPNSTYDPDARREDDPNWAVIGLLGQLRVLDDGTCEPNGYCTVNDQGIATATEDKDHGYRVMSRISDNVIRILFK